MPSEQVETNRFNVDDLRNLFVQMRFSTGPLGNGALLEQQTFINMLVIAFRQGRVPLTWKYEPFASISAFSQKFAVTPLRGPNEIDSLKMYQHTKLGQAAASSPAATHSWVNWKTALTFFALINSPLPSEQELAALRVKLTEAGKDQSVNKKQFCSVEFWFDQFEGKPDAAMQAKWEAERAARQEESEYESEDDGESDLGEISGSNSDSDEMESNNRKKKQMNKKDKSKFFYDVDPVKELTNDIEQEELERISADE